MQHSSTSRFGELSVSELPLSVLLVDNDECMCEILELILNYHRVPNYTVQDAEAALAFLEDNTVAVIITELMLPGMDGYQLVKQVRKAALAPAARFVAISAFHINGAVLEPQKHGFDGFIPKPFDVDDVVPYLQRLVSQAGG
ncbi:MAG: response regulator [Chloroflexi bacterium]|nr:response regulator [Chloroflexota bacterium]